jgi:hypothetical protein
LEIGVCFELLFSARHYPAPKSRGRYLGGKRRQTLTCRDPAGTFWNDWYKSERRLDSKVRFFMISTRLSGAAAVLAEACSFENRKIPLSHDAESKLRLSPTVP